MAAEKVLLRGVNAGKPAAGAAEKKILFRVLDYEKRKGRLSAYLFDTTVAVDWLNSVFPAPAMDLPGEVCFSHGSKKGDFVLFVLYR